MTRHLTRSAKLQRVNLVKRRLMFSTTASLGEDDVIIHPFPGPDSNSQGGEIQTNYLGRCCLS
jgi:hypothetical protein